MRTVWWSRLEQPELGTKVESIRECSLTFPFLTQEARAQQSEGGKRWTDGRH